VQAVLGAESSSIRLLVQLPGLAAKTSWAAFTRAMLCATRQSSLQQKNLAISVMSAVRVPSLCGFKGVFSAMLQISRLVVGHEFDDTRP
jgi:hypothetical protein